MSDNDDAFEVTVTPLTRNANELHEIYMAYMEAGFPEHRAFELAVVILEDHLAS